MTGPPRPAPAFTPTADLCDAHPGALVLAPGLGRYGGRPRFHGPAVTLRVPDDPAAVRAVLEEPGAGRVLVVDNGGRREGAVLGGTLGEVGVWGGWAGVVVNGCVRDAAELATLDLGVRALATHPRRGSGRGPGERDVPLTFAGVTLHPGDHLYADEDGVVVLPAAR